MTEEQLLPLLAAALTLSLIVNVGQYLVIRKAQRAIDKAMMALLTIQTVQDEMRLELDAAEEK